MCVVKIESTYKFNALQILSCLSGSRIDQKTECTNWQPVSIPTSGIMLMWFKTWDKIIFISESREWYINVDSFFPCLYTMVHMEWIDSYVAP